MAETAKIYDAGAEWLRKQRAESGPRNVPASLMAQMRGAAINQLIGNPMVQAASSPGFTGEIAKWNTYSKEEKYERILGVSEIEQLRAAMIMEEDNEILRLMIDRKEDMEKRATG